jgi:hypothetical protein
VSQYAQGTLGATQSPVDAIIARAQSHVGYKEGLNNDNIFAAITKQANHKPWCATFICAIFTEAGYRPSIINSASCEAFEVWAQASKLIVPVEQTKRGDLLLFDFTKSHKAEHIEIAIHDYDPIRHLIFTIGGNTSSGVGNQTNGDGVYQRTRPRELVRAVIRPNYKETHA